MKNDGHEFVQTSPCGRGERHPHGLVGRLWRIKTPESIHVGDCFMAGRLKKGDLWLCVRHSGDCFQTYIFVERTGGFDPKDWLEGKPEITFGSYGIGDSEPIDIDSRAFPILVAGGSIKMLIKEES